MASCPAFNPLGAYVSDVVGLVDCHSLALGEEGWRALGSASPFGDALWGLLVIAVALVGYRALMGDTPSLRDGISLALRIGVVLALATQWGAYRPLIYDLATRAPEELASRILAPGGLGGDDRARLNDRVQAVSANLSSLLHGATVGRADSTAPPSLISNNQVAGPRAAAPDLPTDVLKSADTSNSLLLVSTLAGELSVRVVIGLLLALGPLFVAFLLFEATQGFFVAWLRVLAGGALGAVAFPTVIAVELAILEPQVSLVRRLLETQSPLGGLPEQILATTALFAIVMLALLVAVAMAAGSARLPRAAQARAQALFGDRAASGASKAALSYAAAAPQRVERSRAQQIAEAARMAERRDARLEAGGVGRLSLTERGARPRAESWTAGPASSVPGGRRTQLRAGRGAARRDSQA